MVVAGGRDGQCLRLAESRCDAGQVDRAQRQVFVDGDIADRVQRRLIVDRRDADGDDLEGGFIVAGCREIVIRAAVLDRDRDIDRSSRRIRHWSHNHRSGGLRTRVVDRRDRDLARVRAAGRDSQRLAGLIQQQSHLGEDVGEVDRPRRPVFGQRERRGSGEGRSVVDRRDDDGERLGHSCLVARVESGGRALILHRDLNRRGSVLVPSKRVLHAASRIQRIGEDRREAANDSRWIAEHDCRDLYPFRSRIAVADPAERDALETRSVFEHRAWTRDVVERRRVDDKHGECLVDEFPNIVRDANRDRRRAARVRRVERQGVCRGGSGERR